MPQRDDVQKLLQIALDSFQGGKFDEALSTCAKASHLAPEDFRPHALAGYIYQAQDKAKSASQEFGAAINLQPRNKQLYLLKAAADVQRDARDEAVAACRKALEIWNARTSDDDDIAPSFIVVLERAEKSKRATEVLAQKPNDPDALVEEEIRCRSSRRDSSRFQQVNWLSSRHRQSMGLATVR